MGGERERMTAYCGLYCADCAFHTAGAIPGLARHLRKELRKARSDKVAEATPFLDADDYKRAYGFLGSLVELRCKGCKVGSR